MSTSHISTRFLPGINSGYEQERLSEVDASNRRMALFEGGYTDVTWDGGIFGKNGTIVIGPESLKGWINSWGSTEIYEYPYDRIFALRLSGKSFEIAIDDGRYFKSIAKPLERMYAERFKDRIIELQLDRKIPSSFRFVR